MKKALLQKFSALPILSLLVMQGCGSDTPLESTEQDPDPVVVDIPIAFIKRSLPLDENGAPIEQDLRDPSQFIPGAGLFIKARASLSEAEVNITDRAFMNEGEEEVEAYDVKDLEVSYDGERLLFSMRAPEIPDVDDDEQPTWNIWEYNRVTDELRRIITSDIVAKAGQDTAPVYLADGRILYSSTRQRTNQAILLDEGKPQYSGLEESLQRPASVLHIMNTDGSDITQVSFNQSHDLDPVVLQNGKVMFSRWDRTSTDKGIHLYTMNPDGSDLSILYGRHSHEIEGLDDDYHFVQARETQENQILLSLLPYERTRLGTDVISIDVANFIDNTMPTEDNAGSNEQAQKSALFNNVRLDIPISPGGYFNSIFPLWDGSQRVLFSWSQCRVFDPEQTMPVPEGEMRRVLPCTEELLANEAIESAPELYGLWIFDPTDNTQRPLVVAEETTAYTEVLAMGPRTTPANPAAIAEFNSELAQQNTGALHIRSVYDMAGTDTTPNGLTVMADPSQTNASERPIRFIRIVKGVSIPDDDTLDFDNSAYGRSRGQLMREIIGYAAVEPDGSAKFQVPANVPIALSLLDEQGRRVGDRHLNWLQVVPGEVKTCNGCHERDSESPHGRLDAEAPSINTGAPSTGAAFPNANPALFADLGETMAETVSRINGITYPQPDIAFTDIWSNPATQTPELDFLYAYLDVQTPVPITPSCGQNWTSLCRITVNFPQHIQPLFELTRQTLDEMGTVLEDRTCISCHTPMDADGLPQVPAGQLDLRSDPSPDRTDFTLAYNELMFNDNEQEVRDGAVVDRLIPALDGQGNPRFERDENGELILDADGNPIPILVTVTVRNSVSVGGARASQRFFAQFEQGASHANWLSPAELKLISEWMDIGGQYYNNPFDAPVN